MLSKLILLLGVLISTFIAYSCIQKNKQTLAAVTTRQTTKPVTQSAVSQTPPAPAVQTAEAEQTTSIEKAISYKAPALNYTVTPARMLELTTSKADEDSDFTDKLQNYCKKPLCSLSLHFNEDTAQATWGKKAAALIAFLQEHHVNDASVHIEDQTLTVGGTFASKAEEDAIENLLSGFLDEGFLVNRHFTHKPETKPTAPEKEETPSEALQESQNATPSSDTVTKKETPEVKIQATGTKPETTLAKPVKPVQAQETLEDVQQQQIKKTQNDINTLLKSHPIYFKRNSNELTLSSKKILDKIIDLVNENSEEIARLRIMGHTDASGSAAYNKRLSQKRAEKVRDYLINHRIDVPALEAIGYGEERPLTKNPYAKENRRVEIEISKEDSHE